MEQTYIVYWISTDKETGKRYGMTSTVDAGSFSEAYTIAEKRYPEITQIVQANTYSHLGFEGING